MLPAIVKTLPLDFIVMLPSDVHRKRYGLIIIKLFKKNKINII